MRTRFITFKVTMFYLATKSPLRSKLRVIIWFLYRLFLRLILDFKRMKARIKHVEDQIIESKMKDGAVFLNTIEQLSNLYEIYCKERDEKIKWKLPINPIIVDVGSHIGIYSIRKAIEYPSGLIYSIEPEKKNFEMLKRNIKLNNLKNVIPINIALFDREGHMKLYLDNFGSGQHTLIKKAKRSYKLVKVTTLKNLVRKIKPPSIDLIKIDTEGAEYPIILGGVSILRKFKPFLIIETHPWNDKNCDKKILKLLKRLGYAAKLVKYDGPAKYEGSVIFAWQK